MTLTDWITLISSIATLATAVAALLTIREMRAQRRSIYRPEIAFLRTPVNLYWSDDKLLGAPLVCTSQQGKSAAGLDPFVLIEGRNVGLGAGTNLEATWHFDVNDAIQTIDRLDAQQRFKIWNDENGQIEFNFERPSPRMVAMRHSVLAHTPYMLPVHVSSDPIQISVPWAYVQMFSIWVYLLMQQVAPPAGERKPSHEELPPLEL